MIKIIEREPIKISGVTSLFVTFDFNIEVVNIIKQAEKYVYNKVTHEWELPIFCLSYLLDNLTYLDDITLQLKQENKDAKHYYPKLVDKYKTRPFEHQLAGIEYGLNVDKFLLLDEPGLGKTAQVIHLAEELKEQKGLEHCFVICGINSLKANWEEEIHKHSNESVRILGKRITRTGSINYGSIKDRANEILQPMEAFFLITNIETLRDDNVIDALKKTKNKIGMVVLDEAHRIKNSQSVQGHNLLKLTDYDHKIALTGTLIVNSPVDAYAALKWIGVEHANLTNFKSQYCQFGGFGGHQIVGYKNIDLLKNEISSCSLRRLKSDIKDLPPKTIIPEFLDMEDSHKKFYDDVKHGIKEECDKIELKTNDVLALGIRLKEATTAVSMLTSSPIVSTKIERAIELIDDFIDNGDKVVVMSMFKEPLNVLYDRLKKYNPLLGTGDISQAEFDSNKIKFQEDPKYKVWLGTASKSGTGLTLNAARYMICLDEPYTAALQQQIEDRIHRVNNTEPVFIYKLICKGTIDEVIEKIVIRKRAMSDYMVDDVLDDEGVQILKNYIQDL